MTFNVQMRAPGTAFNIKLTTVVSSDLSVAIVEAGDTVSAGVTVFDSAFAVDIAEAGDNVIVNGSVFTAGAPPFGVALISETGDTLVSSGSVSADPLMVVRLRPVGDRYGTDRVWLDDVDTGVSVGISEAGDTVSASGMVVLPASASILEDGDTVSSSAVVVLPVSASILEDGDTVSSSAVVVVSGPAVILEDGDTLAASAVIQVSVSASILEAGDTLINLTEAICSSTVAIAEDGDTVSCSANARASGAVTIIEDGDTVASSANTVMTWSSAIIEDGDALTSSINAVVSASLAILEDGDTMSASVSFGGDALVAIFEDGDAFEVEGNIAIDSSWIILEDGDTFSGSAEVSGVLLDVDVVEDGDTMSASVAADASLFGDIQEAGDTVLVSIFGVVSESPRLFARGRKDSVDLQWTLNPLVTVLRYDVFRSTEAPPPAHGEGELVYSDTGHSFTDEDVSPGVRYFYTVFGVLGLTPFTTTLFSVMSTASAVLLEEFRPAPVTGEYMPSRGEFGPAVSPVPFTSSKAWGDIQDGGLRRSDVLVSRRGQAVLAPISGVVTDTDVDVIVIEGSGFRFVMSGVSLAAGVSTGKRLRTGDAVGVLSSKELTLEILKLPVGRYGLRSVRPARFYLELTQRDGRGRTT